ncbi:hypothetical protein BDQ17DRAFT_1360405 [Cyathus striatus]|nr:hypothetical protein BDQ17DRAFT_1360405 [Cyathus striatus]
MSTNETRPPYSIPLSYIKDVLFGQVMRSMVEGILAVPEMRTHSELQVSVISTFGASSPALAYIVMASGLLIAVTALTSAHVAGNPSKFDAIRLISLPRSSRLTEMLRDAEAALPEILHNTVIYDCERDELITGSEVAHDSVTKEKSLPI